MRYITANYIFPISSSPIKDGTVVIDDHGIIVSVQDSECKPQNPNLERYKGIICPGFINTHCHLELSHLKGKIIEKTGMAAFIKDLLAKKSNFSKNEIQTALEAAEKEMINNGIVAVGDISNDDSTFDLKKKGNLKYHTFLEVFDINPEKAEEIFKNAMELHKKLSIANCQSSIVPHAPYTVSDKLYKLINEYAQNQKTVLSVHNQESAAENELFINKSGTIAELFKTMGIDLDSIRSGGENSLRSTLMQYPKNNPLLLVHNTYTSREDIKWVHEYFSKSLNSACRTGRSQPRLPDGQVSNLIFWCFCPNANLYIENKLPDIDSFISENANITIGTDSYASNWSLSVLNELKVISSHAPHIPLHVLLTWATRNGAEFLGFDNQLGTIDKGKKPGINLIANIDLENLKLTEKSRVEVLA